MNFRKPIIEAVVARRWPLATGVILGVVAAIAAWFVAIPQPRSAVNTLSGLLYYSPQGRYLCTHGYVDPRGYVPAGRALKIWDASVFGEMSCVAMIPTNEQQPFPAVISPDDRLIAGIEDQRRLTIRSLPDGELVIGKEVEPVNANTSLVWSPDGHWLATVPRHGAEGCLIWDSRTLELACNIPHARQAAFTSVVDRLFVYEVPRGDEVESERGITAGWSVWNLSSRRREAYHADSGLGWLATMGTAYGGQVLIMGTINEGEAIIQLRDAVVGQELATFTGEDQPTVSRDGQVLLTRKFQPSRTDGTDLSTTFQLRDALSGKLRSEATITGEWPTVFTTTDPGHPFLVTTYQRIYSKDRKGWSSPSWRGRLWGHHQQIAVCDATTGVILGRFDVGIAETPVISPDGRSAAWIGPNRDKINQLQVFDLPQRTPWGWIITVSVVTAVAFLALSEAITRWRAAA